MSEVKKVTHEAATRCEQAVRDNQQDMGLDRDGLAASEYHEQIKWGLSSEGYDIDSVSDAELDAMLDFPRWLPSYAL